MLRIAHITDLHIARQPAPGEYNAKRLLGYVNYRLFRSRLYQERIAARALAELMTEPPDLVLLSGDITQHGLDAEFRAAAEMLEPLCGHGVPVIAVPGNHDIYGCVDNSVLEGFVEGLALSLRPDDFGIYRLGEVEVLPLRQGVPTPPFFSHGRQDPRELRLAAEAWREKPEGKMRLVVGHYPLIDPHGGRLLYFRGLREAESLLDFCRQHWVSGYFCGHNHKRFAAPISEGCMQFVAPALSSVRHAAREWISVYECGPGLPSPREVGARR